MKEVYVNKDGTCQEFLFKGKKAKKTAKMWHKDAHRMDDMFEQLHQLMRNYDKGLHHYHGTRVLSVRLLRLFVGQFSKEVVDFYGKHGKGKLTLDILKDIQVLTKWLLDHKEKGL